MAATEPGHDMAVLLEAVVDALGVIVGEGRLHLPADVRAVPARRPGRGARSKTLCGTTSGGVYARGVVDDLGMCRICMVTAANRIRAGDP
jgi:ribosomal protein S14